jgi:hypothetical protein
MDPRSSRFAVLILDSEERPQAAAPARKRAGGKGRARERAGYVVAFEAQSPTPLVAWRLQKVRQLYVTLRCAAREVSHDVQVAVIWQFSECKASAKSIWLLCSVPSLTFVSRPTRDLALGSPAELLSVHFFSKKCLQFDHIPRLVSLCPIPGCLTLLSCVVRHRAFSDCRTPTGGKYLNPGVVPDLCTHSLLSQAGGATLVFLPPPPGSKSRDSQLLIATRERELVRVSVDKNAEEELVAASTPVVSEVAPMETEETEGQ